MTTRHTVIVTETRTWYYDIDLPETDLDFEAHACAYAEEQHNREVGDYRRRTKAATLASRWLYERHIIGQPGTP